MAAGILARLPACPGASHVATLLLHAEKEGRVIISADTDLRALLALRRTVGNRPEQVAELPEGLLPRVSADLAKGSVVTVTDDRIRIRALPVLP